MAEETKETKVLVYNSTASQETPALATEEQPPELTSIQGEQGSQDDPARLQRLTDEKRNAERARQALVLKGHLAKEFLNLQKLYKPVGFIDRAGDLLIFISYPANIVAKIVLPNPRRDTPIVIVYDQIFRRLIRDGNSNFLKDFTNHYVA